MPKYFGKKNGQWIEVDEATYNALVSAGYPAKVESAQQEAPSMQHKRKPIRNPRPGLQQEAANNPQINMSSSSMTPEQIQEMLSQQPQTQEERTLDNLEFGNSSYPNPAATLLSLAFPLTVDEIETDGITSDLVWKAPLDVGLNFFGPGKAAALGTRVGGRAIGNNAVEQIGMKAMSPWTSMNAKTRILGQGGYNAIDNMIATGIQAAADNRDNEILAEQGIAMGLGGMLGMGQGLRSYGNAFDFMQKMHKSVRPRYTTKGDPTPRTREFEMLDRFDDYDFSNAERVVDIYNAQPFNSNFPYLPPSYSQIDDNYRNAIAAKRAETERIIPTLTHHDFNNSGMVTMGRGNNFYGGTPFRQDDINFVLYDINEPPYRNRDIEQPKFFKNLDDFLRSNNFGTIINDRIALYDDVNPMDIGFALKHLRGDKLPNKSLQDWTEELRQSMRQARGGDGQFDPTDPRKDFLDITEPTNDIGTNFNDLEKLHRQRAIMNIAAGADRGSPDFMGVPGINKESRPFLGTADLAPNIKNVPQRAITQGAVEAYDRRDEFKNMIEQGIKPAEAVRDAIPNYQDRLEALKRKIEEEGMQPIYPMR